MDEIFDEVTNDCIKNQRHDEDSNDQVEDIGRQVDVIPGRRYVALKKHRPIVLSVTNP